jgi:hypothetical protein
MTTTYRTLALVLSMSAAALGCATPVADEQEASVEATVTGGLRLDVDGKWTVSRGSFVGEGGATTTIAVENASALLTLARIPTVAEFGDSEEGRTVAATLSFSAPTITGGGERRITADAMCALTAIPSGTVFVSAVGCNLSARDQKGTHWSAQVELDGAGKVATFVIRANHTPTFDILLDFAPNAL